MGGRSYNGWDGNMEVSMIHKGGEGENGALLEYSHSGSFGMLRYRVWCCKRDMFRVFDV